VKAEPRYPYSEWAATSLTPTPGGTADPDLCRQDYLMECSDRGMRWEERSKQRAAVKAVGATVKGFESKGTLVYHDVTLVPLAGTRVSPEEAQKVLASLYAAGLVTDLTQLTAAAAELSKEQ
jgi:hypothetical protein